MFVIIVDGQVLIKKTATVLTVTNKKSTKRIINELTACTQFLIVIQSIRKCQTIDRLRNNGNLKD